MGVLEESCLSLRSKRRRSFSNPLKNNTFSIMHRKIFTGNKDMILRGYFYVLCSCQQFWLKIGSLEIHAKPKKRVKIWILLQMVNSCVGCAQTNKINKKINVLSFLSGIRAKNMCAKGNHLVDNKFKEIISK